MVIFSVKLRQILLNFLLSLAPRSVWIVCALYIYGRTCLLVCFPLRNGQNCLIFSFPLFLRISSSVYIWNYIRINCHIVHPKDIDLTAPQKIVLLHNGGFCNHCTLKLCLHNAHICAFPNKCTIKYTVHTTAT